MKYSTKIIGSKAKKKHCWTYNCRKIRNRKSSPLMFNFCEVLLVAPWSLTLAGLILAGANSKPHITHKSTKNEGPSKKEFHGKTV